MNAKEQLAIESFIECGPARVLAGLARRTDKTLSVGSISEYGDIEALSEA